MALTPYGGQAALAANATQHGDDDHRGPTNDRGVFLWNGKRKVSGYVDARNLLARIEYWNNNDMLGDVDLVTTTQVTRILPASSSMKIVRMNVPGRTSRKFSAGEGCRAVSRGSTSRGRRPDQYAHAY